ncbi:MAG TPA: hypothetical protein VKA59_02680 [Vicinamibacterales bacterium]|jgi:hypothetical protein|nr:hypothetical protein [Vicinamibacterales bacterium]
MRPAILVAGLTLALVSITTTAGAQVRGRMTSRPQTPSANPRSPAPPILPFPIWAGVVTLPEIVTLAQAPFGANAPTGGVQLDIQPWSSQVYVDGASVGRVEQFRGYYRHLELPAGPHTIAIVSDGRDPFIFGVMVVPGRVVTQRATLGSAGTYTP